jgi:hypothetical protein
MDDINANLPPANLSIAIEPNEDAPTIPIAEVIEHPPESKLRKALHAASYAIKSAVVTAEILPVTNEGSRYGAFAATELITRNPVVGAAVLGGSTLLVEGAGALAASDLITRPTSNRLFNWLNEKLEKVVPANARISKPVEAAIAMTAGTPMLMAAKQRENPERTTEEARRHGLLTATWMAGVFAVEGALVSEGIDKYTDPKMVGAALLTTGAIVALPSWVKRALNRNSEKEPKDLERVSRIIAGGALTEEQIASSASVYESYRDENDEAVKVGLYGEDLQDALNNSRSVLVEYTGKKGDTEYMPLLVPAAAVKWYNMDVLRARYGYGKEYYYYAHPPIPADDTSQKAIANAIKERLDKGAIIFTDQYAGESDKALEVVADTGTGTYSMESLGGGDVQRTAEVFTGPLNFKGAEGIKPGLPINEVNEVYRHMVESGELSESTENGVALAGVIEGEEAERIWEIYKAPFDELSKEHPMYAGFNKEELMDILADPAVAKVVNRVDGAISTLCFFVDDFDHCPWFNKEYYRQNYPEYYDTNNIFMFPGIVTDENMRGNDYAMQVIDLAMKLYSKRGSNVLVTFECTETSAVYIPTIVEMAIGHSGEGKITGIDQAISVTEYKALRRS